VSPGNIEILDYSESPIGLLCLRRRELLSQPGTVVTEVTVNHEFLMSSLNTLSERELSRRALEFHGGSGLSVLVGGLGLGYTAHEAISSSKVDRVDVVEMLPQVISWLERGLYPLAEGLRDDDSVRVIEDDVFRCLASEPENRYDAILVDVDHSPDELLDPRNGAFYGADGLRAAREHLTDHGVLAVWSSAGSDEFVRALESVFAEARAEPVEWVNELIDEEQSDVVFLARR
jgi:spermidine synthase